MTNSAGSLDVIPADECYQLLATQEVGRIGVVVEDHPLIVPVNYGLDGRTVVVRTHPGTMLSAALRTTVAFEVDDIDRRTRQGWSVLVIGPVQEIRPEDVAALVERTHGAEVRPWAPGEHGVWLRLDAQTVSGRRIVRGQLPWGVDDRAYL